MTVTFALPFFPSKMLGAMSLNLNNFKIIFCEFELR